MTATGALAPSRRVDSTWSLRVAAIGALIALRIVVVLVVLDTPGAHNRGTAFRYDAGRMHRIAEHSGVPYRDFEVEYPPGSLALIEVINAPTVDGTMQNLALASVMFDLVAAIGVAYGWGRRAFTAYLVVGFPFLLLPFVYFRVDLLSVALAIWGFALVKRRRDVAGGVVLAASVLAKFWPLGLAPAFAVQRRWRALTAFIATGAVGGLGWLAFAGMDGPQQVLTFRGATGWNTESLGGNVVRLVTGGRVFQQAGAIRTGHMPSWASPLLALALALLVGGIWWTVSRVRSGAAVLMDGVAPVVATCAFLVCSPVLSPQYLIWLTPFAAICWAGGQRRLAVMVGVVNVLTIILSTSYQELNAMDTGAYILLTARNIGLVLLLIEGFRVVRAARRTSQSTLPGADGAPLMSSMR